ASSATKPATEQSADDYERQQHERVKWLWSKRRPITGTTAERYLRGGGITCRYRPEQQIQRAVFQLSKTQRATHITMIAAGAVVGGVAHGIGQALARLEGHGLLKGRMQ